MVSSGLLLPSTSAARFTTFVCRCSRRGNTVISIASEKTPKFSSSSLSLPLRSSNDVPPSDAPVFTSSVRSPPLIFPPPHRLWSQHALLLNVVACAAAISASWLFLSAIPTLLAFKRAAESLEKLLDVAREELPDTMAAVRLSGMEMSDLTMELSDLGQEITQGVRNSTRAVRLVEGKLRQFTTTSPMASIQVQETQEPRKESSPALARTARRLRERLVKVRAMLGSFASLNYFLQVAWNFLTTQQNKRFP